MNQNIDANLGLNFDNDYDRLPKSLLSKVAPEPVASPELVLTNNSYAKSIDLDLNSDPFSSILSWLLIPDISSKIKIMLRSRPLNLFILLQ